MALAITALVLSTGMPRTGRLVADVLNLLAWIVRAAVILFGDDVHASVREILFVFPYICGAIGVNILMSAMCAFHCRPHLHLSCPSLFYSVQAMPTFVWDHEAQKTQYLWVPSARQCFIALGIYTFFNFATLITTHVYLGYAVFFFFSANFSHFVNVFVPSSLFP